MQRNVLVVHYLYIASKKGASDKALYEKYIREGLEVSLQAYELAKENPRCCVWYGIFLDLSGRLEGITARIKNSYTVKELLEKAIELDPDYFVAHHSLGVWHYEVADLPYAKRLAAKAFFATPPSSTYANALPCLTKAHELMKEKPYISNSMYLAKTYYQLSKKPEAREWCNAVINSEDSDLDAIEAKTEAKALIKRV